jgi:predicted nucleic acid-binding protein
MVLDASVALAWFVRSQANDKTLALLDHVDQGWSVVVPALWSFEVANSLLILCRRKVIDETHYEQSRSELHNLRPVIDDEGLQLALSRTSDLARKQVLSVYDAAYLELALRRDLPLASRDTALNKAAKRAGIRTLL